MYIDEGRSKKIILNKAVITPIQTRSCRQEKTKRKEKTKITHVICSF